MVFFLQVKTGERAGIDIYGEKLDGVKSAIRTCMTHGLGPDAPTSTGDSAHRATISTQGMLNDPELKHFVNGAESTFWMGPDMHVVGYCLVRVLLVVYCCVESSRVGDSGRRGSII